MLAKVSDNIWVMADEVVYVAPVTDSELVEIKCKGSRGHFIKTRWPILKVVESINEAREKCKQ